MLYVYLLIYTSPLLSTAFIKCRKLRTVASTVYEA